MGIFMGNVEPFKDAPSALDIRQKRLLAVRIRALIVVGSLLCFGIPHIWNGPTNGPAWFIPAGLQFLLMICCIALFFFPRDPESRVGMVSLIGIFLCQSYFFLGLFLIGMT